MCNTTCHHDTYKMYSFTCADRFTQTNKQGNIQMDSEFQPAAVKCCLSLRMSLRNMSHAFKSSIPTSFFFFYKWLWFITSFSCNAKEESFFPIPFNVVFFLWTSLIKTMDLSHKGSATLQTIHLIKKKQKKNKTLSSILYPALVSIQVNVNAFISTENKVTFV